MHRRQFLGAVTASALLGRVARAESFPVDLKITRIVSFDLHTRRSKLAGKNAVRGVHGSTSRDRMARLFTNAGVEGLGRCWRDKESLGALLGKNPFQDFDLASRQMPGPLESRTMVLWDLAGKLLKKPVYQLLGSTEGGKVPVYDGSVYFADLLPQYADRWRDRFKEEIDMGLRAGHRAFKIKIGRGHKWMEREAGDTRDVEVVEIIRKHAGDDVLLAVDANNGYDLAGAKRFLDRTSDFRLAFFEEPFPEQVQQCLELKRFIAERGFNTLLADGEGQHELAAYRPFVEAKAIDVLQGDMNSFGIEGILAEAAMARPHGILVAPHNWSSLLALYLQAHVGLVVPNFYRAEHDPLTSDVLRAEGYQIDGGLCSVPDAPGFGLAIDESRFDRVTVNFDLRA
ncbi:MAG: enolase C-terminal domain-like protein [Planctomycetota bacterium]